MTHSVVELVTQWTAWQQLYSGSFQMEYFDLEVCWLAWLQQNWHYSTVTGSYWSQVQGDQWKEWQKIAIKLITF